MGSSSFVSVLAMKKVRRPVKRRPAAPTLPRVVQQQSSVTPLPSSTANVSTALVSQGQGWKWCHATNKIRVVPSLLNTTDPWTRLLKGNSAEERRLSACREVRLQESDMVNEIMFAHLLQYDTRCIVVTDGCNDDMTMEFCRACECFHKGHAAVDCGCVVCGQG